MSVFGGGTDAVSRIIRDTRRLQTIFGSFIALVPIYSERGIRATKNTLKRKLTDLCDLIAIADLFNDQS